MIVAALTLCSCTRVHTPSSASPEENGGTAAADSGAPRAGFQVNAETSVTPSTDSDVGDGPPPPNSDVGDGPPPRSDDCPMGLFIGGLGSLHEYEGEFDPSKSPEVNDRFFRDFEKLVHEEVEFTDLGDGIKRVPRNEIAKQLVQRKGEAFLQFNRLAYELGRLKSADLRLRPTDSGPILIVDRYFHVRFLGEFCSGPLVEIRDTDGEYALPRSPHVGQVGYDCHRDRSVLERGADLALVGKALRVRTRALPGVTLKHQVFPNGSKVLIRETETASGVCQARYLTASPNFDTCDGVNFEISETVDACCSVEDCSSPELFHFHEFMDALSLREMSKVKRYIQPGGSLVVSGSVVEQPLELNARTSEDRLRVFTEKSPRWAGDDHSYCRQSGEGKASCGFGGGGTFFTVQMVSDASGKRWYVTEIVGERH